MKYTREPIIHYWLLWVVTPTDMRRVNCPITYHCIHNTMEAIH